MGGGVGFVSGCAYLLVLSVRGGDNVRQVLVVHLDDVLQEVQVRLVVVVVRVGLVQVWDKRCATTGAELGDWDRRADADNILQVEVGLAAVGHGVLVIQTTMIFNNSEVLALGVGGDILLKKSKIRIPRILLQVAGESHLVAIGSISLVVTDFVQVFETLRRNGVVAVSTGRQHGLAELLISSLGLAVQGHAVRVDLAEASGRSDEVDVRDKRVWDRVLQCTQALDMLEAVDIVLEVGFEEVIGLLHGGLEGHPVRILLDVGDSSSLEPV